MTGSCLSMGELSLVGYTAGKLQGHSRMLQLPETASFVNDKQQVLIRGNNAGMKALDGDGG